MITLTFNYDINHDVMYIATPNNRDAYSEEVSPGVMRRYAMDNEEIVGLTILDFKKNCGQVMNMLALFADPNKI